MQASEPISGCHEVCLQVHFADGTTVDAALAVTVVLAMYDSAGSLSTRYSRGYIVQVLEALPSSIYCVCPFSLPVTLLLICLGCTVTFGSLVVLFFPQQPADAVELCSLYALQRHLCKGLGDAWYCLLQPVASCLSMGGQQCTGVRIEGISYPNCPGHRSPIGCSPDKGVHRHVFNVTLSFLQIYVSH